MKKPSVQYAFAMLAVVVHICSAATLKQIQAYPEQDKLDVLLLLDSAFSGEVGTASVPGDKIAQKMTMISQVTSARKWSESFQISPIKKLEIIPNGGNLYLSVESRKRYYVKPSISKDKNTLRLSFFPADSGIVDSLLQTPTMLKPASMAEVFQKDQSIPEESSLKESPIVAFSDNLKSHDIDMGKYWYIIAGLVGTLAILLYVRKQVRKSSGLNDSLKIVSQSQIDPKNKVIIIETKEYFYMVLLGENGNLLLDKIPRQDMDNLQDQSRFQLQKIGDDKAFDEKFWNTLKNAK